MRIEVHLPIGTDPSTFDQRMETAAKEQGYTLLRRSGMPVDYTSTIVCPNKVSGNGDTVRYIALSAELYKLEGGK